MHRLYVYGLIKQQKQMQDDSSFVLTQRQQIDVRNNIGTETDAPILYNNKT